MNFFSQVYDTLYIYTPVLKYQYITIINQLHRITYKSAPPPDKYSFTNVYVDSLYLIQYSLIQ